jgi:ATP-dependent Clp protease protease subunit
LKIKIKGVIIPNNYKWLYDWFEMDSTCPKDIETQLEALKDDEEIELEVNSPGGDVYAGSEIYTALKQHSGNIIAKVVGIAASAASVVIMAAKTVLISPTAQIMVHNVWSRTSGDYRAMEHEAGVLKGWNKSIANAYMLKTGMTQTELLNFMNKETWLTAQDAVKYKFADEIMFDEGMQLTAGPQSAMLPKEVIDKIRSLVKGQCPMVFDEKELDAKKLAEVFRSTERFTAPINGAEGSGFITVSGTMANMIADFLDKLPEPKSPTATVDPPQSTDPPQATDPTGASRQVPVDLYTKLYSDLERRAKIC